MSDLPLLSVTLALPLLGALAILLTPASKSGLARWIAAVVSALGAVLMVPLWLGFDRAAAGFQFLEHHEWIPRLGISYRLGIDGIALLLLLLTLLLLPLVVMGSWKTIDRRVKEYYLFLLLLQAGMLGVFMALDVFLFYVFWELMLVPMYFLIGIWGGEQRLHAAIKFFLYTMAGSVLMLLAILKLYFENVDAATGEPSFNLVTMLQLELPPQLQLWLFLAFFAGFAIKVPMFPFHTWLPAAHGQAPTAGSVILAGVLLKMGTYGFVRFCLPIFPDATRQALPWLLALCIAGIIYGALTAMAQSDMKQLVAYSSISHLGFVMLGVFCLNPNGLSGGLLQMINHGLSTGALFFLVGMIYERRHTKEIADYGGIAAVVPVYSTLFFIVTLSSIGLPGLNGFVGEFTILAGAIELAAGDDGSLSGTGMLVTALAATGVVLGAAYMLWLVKRVFFGPLKHEENAELKDVSVLGLEFWSVAPLIAVCFWIGLYPKPFFEILDRPVRQLVEVVRPDYFDAPAVADALPRIELPVEAAEHGRGETGGGHH
jgi:NADH-quinone oxidoreductase subunit M